MDISFLWLLAPLPALQPPDYLVTWTERFLFWLKLYRLSCFFHVQPGESRSVEALALDSPISISPALTLAVPIYPGIALSGVTFPYQSPQLWFQLDWTVFSHTVDLVLFDNCASWFFSHLWPPFLYHVPAPTPPEVLKSPTLSLSWHRATLSLRWSLHTCVFNAAQVQISLQPAVWYPARSLVAMTQTELISYLSPQVHSSLHVPLGHGVTSTLLLKPRTKDHSWLLSLRQSNLLNTTHAAPSLLRLTLSYRSHLLPGHQHQPPHSASCLWPFLHPVVARVTFLQGWSGCVPALAYPPPLPITFSPSTLTHCQPLPSGQGQSSLGLLPSLRHTPVTPTALRF